MRWRKCAHINVRCIHGDEIIARMSWRGVIRRASCLDCGKTLDRGLPDYCWFTAMSHYPEADECFGDCDLPLSEHPAGPPCPPKAPPGRPWA